MNGAQDASLADLLEELNEHKKEIDELRGWLRDATEEICRNKDAIWELENRE